jgi:hypothetical protein
MADRVAPEPRTPKRFPPSFSIRATFSEKGMADDLNLNKTDAADFSVVPSISPSASKRYEIIEFRKIINHEKVKIDAGVNKGPKYLVYLLKKIHELEKQERSTMDSGRKYELAKVIEDFKEKYDDENIKQEEIASKKAQNYSYSNHYKKLVHPKRVKSGEGLKPVEIKPPNDDVVSLRKKVIKEIKKGLSQEEAAGNCSMTPKAFRKFCKDHKIAATWKKGRRPGYKV